MKNKGKLNKRRAKQKRSNKKNFLKEGSKKLEKQEMKQNKERRKQGIHKGTKNEKKNMKTYLTNLRIENNENKKRRRNKK